jgi:hypothetical protein
VSKKAGQHHTDERFRDAVMEHIEFGTHIATKNSNAATEDEAW